MEDWFDLDVESPYMLLVAQVAQSKLLPISSTKAYGMELLKQIRSQIPAITHVDNSARIQTVNKYTNPEYHELIKEFYNLSGCPVILNTSFNVRGEPIVADPEDAYKCFMRTDMDILVLGDYILYKDEQPQFNDILKWDEVYELD